MNDPWFVVLVVALVVTASLACLLAYSLLRLAKEIRLYFAARLASEVQQLANQQTRMFPDD